MECLRAKINSFRFYGFIAAVKTQTPLSKHATQTELLQNHRFTHVIQIRNGNFILTPTVRAPGGRMYVYQGEGCTCIRGKDVRVRGGRMYVYQGEGCTCTSGKDVRV